MMRWMSSCKFCKICDKTAPATIYYEDEEVMVFKDLHPVSDIHLLCIPKNHVSTVKDLTQADKPMLKKLINVGRKVLVDKGGHINDALMGFHWPPFNSIHHLHLHVISSPSKISMLHKERFGSGTIRFVSIPLDAISHNNLYNVNK